MLVKEVKAVAESMEDLLNLRGKVCKSGFVPFYMIWVPLSVQKAEHYDLVKESLAANGVVIKELAQ